MFFSPEEIRYYNRQIIMNDVGADGQFRLKKSRVLVVGTGGLGSPCLYYLAGAGVGHIDIMDFDTVDASNLHRQILFDSNHIGASKTGVAGERLAALNPHITIGLLDIKADADTLEPIVADYDVVMDCTDRLETKLLINDVCLKKSVPLCFGGVLGTECQITTIIPHQTPCLRCIFGDASLMGNALPTCAEAGVIGSVSGTAGTIMATEAIKLITKSGTPLLNSMLIIDAFSNRYLTIECTIKSGCLCAE